MDVAISLTRQSVKLNRMSWIYGHLSVVFPLTKDFLMGLVWTTFRLAMADVTGHIWVICSAPIVKLDQVLQKAYLNQTFAVKFRPNSDCLAQRGPNSDQSPKIRT